MQLATEGNDEVSIGVDHGSSSGTTGNNPEQTNGSVFDNSFSPVMTGEFQPSEESKDSEDGLISRLGNLLQNSLSGEQDGDAPSIPWKNVGMDDQDLKGRYYYDKFQFTPFDEEKHLALRKAYIEGLVWNLKYYYEGCVSWEWYFPYHYGKSSWTVWKSVDDPPLTFFLTCRPNA
jgi:5'-3' exonuclease